MRCPAFAPSPPQPGSRFCRKLLYTAVRRAASLPDTDGRAVWNAARRCALVMTGTACDSAAAGEPGWAANCASSVSCTAASWASVSSARRSAPASNKVRRVGQADANKVSNLSSVQRLVHRQQLRLRQQRPQVVQTRFGLASNERA